MKQVKSFFESLFKADKGSISSKRVCGFMIVCVVIYIYIYCTHTTTNPPSGIGELLIAGVTLLGVDSVTGIWKNKNSDDNAN